jgi:plasmid replication initiation protein
MGINYKRFTSVIERVIDPSLEEIRNKTSIKNIKFHKIKTGKKITHIKFDFEFVDRQLKLQYPTYLPSAIDLELYQRMVEKFRLSKVQTTKIMDNVSTKEIKMTLRDIQMNVNDGKVHNVGAYTFRTFSQKYQII